MNLTKGQIVSLFSFLFFFILTGVLSIIDQGFFYGLYVTTLIWTFFVLCMPMPRNGALTKSVMGIFTSRALQKAGLISWGIALGFNLLTTIFAPYLYVSSVTTFILYRVVSNPWPHWIILFSSLLPSFFKHIILKILFSICALAIFVYFSYIELIIFLYAKTC